MARFVLDPGNPPRLSVEANARIDALSDDDIERMQAGDPDASPPSEEMLERAAVGRSIRLTRERLGLSQDRFAARFRIPVGTLRDWEQGRRRPDAPTRAYLLVIERDPEAVDRALNAA